jgi:acyl carrier protein
MTTEEIEVKLVTHIQDNLLSDDQDVTINETTPLLKLGVLDSLKTAVLLNYIRSELKVMVPAERLTAHNFTDVRNIAAMVSDLSDPASDG